MVSEELSRNHWAIELRPRSGSALLAVVLGWAFCAFVWWMIVASGAPIPAWWPALMLGPFAALLAWYGLGTALFASGTIRADRDGFSVSSPTGKRVAHSWEEIDEFYVATAYGSPIYGGREVTHFRLKTDRSEGWLPLTGGLPPHRLAAAMEELRNLAVQQWPRLPAGFDELGRLE